MADKKKGKKGLGKAKPDVNNPDENPLLKIDNKSDFYIYTGNLLETPTALIFEGYDAFDISKDKGHFETDKLSDTSSIIVVLRYYEYMCVCVSRFSYIVPLLESGMKMKEVFDMLKHALKNRLLMNVPSFDTVFEPEIQYIGKIKY